MKLRFAAGLAAAVMTLSGCTGTDTGGSPPKKLDTSQAPGVTNAITRPTP